MAIDTDILSLAPLNDGIQHFWSILAWFFKSPTPKQMGGVTFKFNGVFVQLRDNIIEARQTQALSVASFGMRQLKRRILKRNGHHPSFFNALSGISEMAATPLRSSLPKKKQRELGMRPSVNAELWQGQQERERLKVKCKQQNLKQPASAAF